MFLLHQMEAETLMLVLLLDKTNKFKIEDFTFFTFLLNNRHGRFGDQALLRFMPCLLGTFRAGLKMINITCVKKRNVNNNV